MDGMLIAFEGIDGCGKTTQLERTKTWLESLGFQVRNSHEPNYETSMGLAIQEWLQKKRPMPENPVKFQELYVWNRFDDIVDLISPALKNKYIYLIDRFTLSTIAYGILSGKPAKFFIDMHEEIIGSYLLWPHLNIVIDVSGQEAARRLAENRSKPEYFERADVLARVREHYLALARMPEFQKRTAVINGERSVEDVFVDVKRAIERVLPIRD